MKADDFVDAMIKLQNAAGELGAEITEMKTSRDQAEELMNTFVTRGGVYGLRLPSTSQLPVTGGVIGSLVGIDVRVPPEMIYLKVLPTAESIETVRQQLAKFEKEIKA
jgi:hypothetical protein